MKRQMSSNACLHRDQSRIVPTPDGERVCMCGVVLEERVVEPFVPSSHNRVSLYHRVEVGGSPQDMKVVNRRIHVYSPGSSEFSNICGKLFMSESNQNRAWHIYKLLRSNSDFTRAKCAMFSIYVACREGGQPVDERQITDSVCSAFGVRQVPNMLGTIYELHDTALRFGIDSNKRHSPEYYLNVEMRHSQDCFDTYTYGLFREVAAGKFAHLKGNPKNRARRAVAMTLCEMGVRR